MEKITKKEKSIFILVAIGLIASLVFSSVSITGSSVLSIDSAGSRNIGAFLFGLSLIAFVSAKFSLKK